MDESDISSLEQTLMATKEAGDTYLRSVLTKFVFRWVLLTFFCFYLWNLLPLRKWILLPLLPLFFYSLYQIYSQCQQFQQQIKEIQALLDEVKSLDTSAEESRKI